MVCIRSSLSDNTLGSSKTAEKEFLGEGGGKRTGRNDKTPFDTRLVHEEWGWRIDTERLA